MQRDARGRPARSSDGAQQPLHGLAAGGEAGGEFVAKGAAHGVLSGEAAEDSHGV